MFVLLDYRECYRALLYLGYDRRVEECFEVTRGKRTYADLLRLKDRDTFCLLFVDSE